MIIGTAATQDLGIPSNTPARRMNSMPEKKGLPSKDKFGSQPIVIPIICERGSPVHSPCSLSSLEVASHSAPGRLSFSTSRTLSIFKSAQAHRLSGDVELASASSGCDNAVMDAVTRMASRMQNISHGHSSLIEALAAADEMDRPDSNQDRFCGTKSPTAPPDISGGCSQAGWSMPSLESLKQGQQAMLHSAATQSQQQDLLDDFHWHEITANLVEDPCTKK